MDNKEEEISRRIELMRKKNELLEQRHKEVQADKKSAETSGQSIQASSSTSASPRYDSPRERTSVGNKKGSPFSRAHMDDAKERNDQQTNYRSRRIPQRGRGQSNANPAMLRRGRGGRPVQSYEAKRKENFRMMEEEMAHTEDNALPGEGDSSPGISRLLDDPRRKGDYGPDNRWKSTRHRGSYGGLHFENVKVGMRRGGRANRGRGRGISTRLQLTAEYTGRERQDQQRWQTMREAADRHPVQHSEPHTRGRGRRGFKRDSNTRERSKSHKEDLAGSENKGETEAEKNVHQEEASTASPAKPQPARHKQVKSPGHLLQQRAQTPSSKDGTEVWAQNSHHSDEAGGDWKNGANRSGDQWLPSLEGNSNPAIDERLLEQQEDGATMYSKQLGRGWGSEKNIKATKAWVIDTEKAGVAQGDGGDNVAGTDVKRPDKADDKYSTSHSASPRLKKKSLGLTVEIDKAGRRVKAHSSQPDDHSTSETQISRVDDVEKSGTTDVLSPDFLKTPEDVKHMDWAAEVDMQSPTYEARQLELMKSSDPLSKQSNEESNSTPRDHPDSNQLRQEDTPVGSSNEPSNEITHMPMTTEKSETQTNSALSADEGSRMSESNHPHEDTSHVTGGDVLAMTQSPQSVDKLETLNTDSTTQDGGDVPKTSPELDAVQQQIETDENSSKEIVEEMSVPPPVKELHTGGADLTVNEGEVSSNSLEPEREQTPEQDKPFLISSDIPVENDKLPQTIVELEKTADATCEKVGTEKSDTTGDSETENQMCPVVQEVDTTEANGVREQAVEHRSCDISDEKDVDGTTAPENDKHEVMDTNQNERRLSQDVDNNADDEFFDCDEDRKKEPEESIQLHLTDATAAVANNQEEKNSHESDAAS